MMSKFTTTISGPIHGETREFSANHGWPGSRYFGLIRARKMHRGTRVTRLALAAWLLAACGDDPSANALPDDADVSLDAEFAADAGAPDADRGRPIPRDAGSLRAVDVAGRWCEVGEPLYAELGPTGELRSWTFPEGAWIGRWWIEGDGVAFRWEAHVAIDNTGERLPGEVVTAPAHRDGDRLIIGERVYAPCSGPEDVVITDADVAAYLDGGAP